MPQQSLTIPLRPLGSSGMQVSEIGFGLWAAGGGWGPVQERDTFAAIDTALDAGVNFYDTADVYGNGLSEELLGRAMEGRRDRFIVATKVGWVGYDGKENRSAYTTVEKVEAAVDLALKRLRTDHIDVLQNHIFYREPNTDVMRHAFHLLRAKGKVRAFGVSTGSFEFLKDFASDGGTQLLQIDYSILNREPEQQILPWCASNGIGVIIRGPLAMGILTGKLSAKSTFIDGDFRQSWLKDPELNKTYLADLARVEQLRPLAREGRNLAQAALQFCLLHPAVSTVIPGAKDPGQMATNAGVVGAPPLTASEVKLIDSVVPPGGGRKIWPA